MPGSKDFLSNEEVKKLQDIAFEDGVMRKHAFDLNDQTGKKTKLTLWYKPGNDTFGLLTRSNRMIAPFNELMDGDSSVCHFHSKLMQKEPKWAAHGMAPGLWLLVQERFLLPEQMMSVMIAITDANKANGWFAGN
jgi:hypothetical protein